MSDRDEALLGLATNEEMLRELIVRFTVASPRDEVGSFVNTYRALSLAEMIGGMSAPEREYRTVG